jgi:hypothetical protein
MRARRVDNRCGRPCMRRRSHAVSALVRGIVRAVATQSRHQSTAGLLKQVLIIHVPYVRRATAPRRRGACPMTLTGELAVRQSTACRGVPARAEGSRQLFSTSPRLLSFLISLRWRAVGALQVCAVHPYFCAGGALPERSRGVSEGQEPASRQICQTRDATDILCRDCHARPKHLREEA